MTHRTVSSTLYSGQQKERHVAIALHHIIHLTHLGIIVTLVTHQPHLYTTTRPHSALHCAFPFLSGGPEKLFIYSPRGKHNDTLSRVSHNTTLYANNTIPSYRISTHSTALHALITFKQHQSTGRLTTSHFTAAAVGRNSRRLRQGINK